MTKGEYQDKIYYQLAMLHGFSFNHEAGPIPWRSVQSIRSKIWRNPDMVGEGFESGAYPGDVAERIFAKEGGRL